MTTDRNDCVYSNRHFVSLQVGAGLDETLLSSQPAGETCRRMYLHVFVYEPLKCTFNIYVVNEFSSVTSCPSLSNFSDPVLPKIFI